MEFTEGVVTLLFLILLWFIYPEYKAKHVYQEIE